MSGKDITLTEKCGIFGVFGKDMEAARLTYAGLWALQHRGQESSGISASNGKSIHTHTGQGLVSRVYDESSLRSLQVLKMPPRESIFTRTMRSFPLRKKDFPIL